MKKAFEKTLPEGYKEILCVDATNKKLIFGFSIANLLITVGIIMVSFAVIRPNLFDIHSLVVPLVFAISLFAYIVLHELVHGIAYKSMTGEKLTYGFTLAVAYCGVPNIYVYRRTALIALLAPFTVFSILFIVLALIMANPIYKFLVMCLFAFHFGGCVGDLYDTYLFFTKLKSPSILMQDTGPKQTFYQIIFKAI